MNLRKIYIIGTLHNMLPKHKEELESLLEEIDPDQILVEIVNKDLQTAQFKKYPNEMVFAYKWGVQIGKKISGFDAPIDIVKKSLTKEELKSAEEESYRIIEKYGLKWTDFNKRKIKHAKELDSLDNIIIDLKKHKLRQKKMLENIRKIMIENGIILILTGSAHLDFFEKNIKEAIFPLRG